MPDFERPDETAESPKGSYFVREPLIAARPRRASRIDWSEVARLLAAGHTTAHVAQLVGCSRRHIWRILRRSRRLNQALAREMEHEAANASFLLAALRPAVAEALERELVKGNVNVLLRLADRLNVFERPTPAEPPAAPERAPEPARLREPARRDRRTGPAIPPDHRMILIHEERLKELE